ncbi:MAG: putative RNA-binding protein (virulence factor B family) [Lysobacterales bacterium]|jgi:predicted RNA-binding protein (virulence factor B family)
MTYEDEFVYLKVSKVTPGGAYLDWDQVGELCVGLDDQEEEMVKGESYVVKIIKDANTGIYRASSKIMQFVELENIPYVPNDAVDLLLYDQSMLGFSAIINNQHIGLIHIEEVFKGVSVGQRLKGYIRKIREDRKIDLCLQRQGHQNPTDLANEILDFMKANGGVSKVTDKSDANLIGDTFGVSKKKFKMAVGRLYKERKITVDGNQLKISK